eukprot:scaffold27687_cov38-Phaeocystis_antarctica.AAC.4
MREGRLGHRLMERASRETQDDDEGASRAKRQKGSASQSSPDDSPTHAPGSPLRVGITTAGKSLTPTSIGRQHSSARLWSPAAPRTEGEPGDSPTVSRQPSLQPPAFAHRTLSGGGGGGGGGAGEEEEGETFLLEEESVIRVGTGYQAHVPKYAPPVSVSEEEEEALAECATTTPLLQPPYHTPLPHPLTAPLTAPLTTPLARNCCFSPHPLTTPLTRRTPSPSARHPLAVYHPSCMLHVHVHTARACAPHVHRACTACAPHVHRMAAYRSPPSAPHGSRHDTPLLRLLLTTHPHHTISPRHLTPPPTHPCKVRGRAAARRCAL